MNKLETQLNTFLRKAPTLGKDTYIATGAVVLGDVTLGDHTSVWYNAVVRGDINRIVVGHHSNIQDNAVLHLADDYPCIVGDYVTIGHSAIVHACTVGHETLIGMGATLAFFYLRIVTRSSLFPNRDPRLLESLRTTN